MATILCVDDDADVGVVLERGLQRAGHATITARHVPEALHALATNQVDLIISDYQMPGITGLEFLEMLATEGISVPLIMLTGHASIEHAVTAIKAGAIDYLPKPVDPKQLQLAVEQALEVVRLRRENDALRREVTALRNQRQILGESVAIRRLMETVAMAAPTRATVLLQGESGTGKELFARAIHDQSDRHDKPFIQLNCAALPEGLIESALFGHEKGAFTGAVKRVDGAFERAHRGTLLLDEISEMRLDLQAKLLRVLQEQEFERVGGTQPVRVDVRVIATTNRNLQREAEAGRFRQDLYYRLSTIPVAIPPLRERPEDIPLLAYRFALRTAQDLGRQFEGLSPDCVAMLKASAWPGNVRELQHAVERAVILSTGPVLTPSAFDGARFGLATEPVPGRTPTSNPTVASTATDPDAIVIRSLNVADAESVLIERALERAGQNRTRAAELLGISVRTLRNKLTATPTAAPPDAAPEVIADVPIIFITALSELADKVRAFEVGGADYITKPFQVEEVLARVRVHLALRSARVALARNLEHVESLERLRDQLVHMVVHDMRSPLTVVLARLQFLKEDAGDRLAAESLEDLNAAHDAAAAVGRMANDLLDVSRMEEGRLPIDRLPVDLAATASAVQTWAAGWQRGRSIALEADGPVVASCDVGLIRRVLENLVSNAIKHTPADGRIQIRVQGGSTVRVAVSDEGPGVPDDARERIFEKFGTVSARQEHAYHSAGLGLTFCKMAVEAHGGRIGVSPGSPRGSEFWFELPADRAGP